MSTKLQPSLWVANEFQLRTTGVAATPLPQPEAETILVNPAPILALRVFDAIDGPHHSVACCQVPRSTALEPSTLVRIALPSLIHPDLLRVPEGPLSRSFRSYSGVAVVTCPPCARPEPAQAALPERRSHRGSLMQ
jgi:hypothetical protein